MAGATLVLLRGGPDDGAWFWVELDGRMWTWTGALPHPRAVYVADDPPTFEALREWSALVLRYVGRRLPEEPPRPRRGPTYPGPPQIS